MGQKSKKLILFQDTLLTSGRLKKQEGMKDERGRGCREEMKERKHRSVGEGDNK